jgi:hypothetical protein
MRVPLTLKSAPNNASSQETDKAVIDVEAQEDGILAKIIVCGIPVMVLTSRSSRVHVIVPGRLEECCRR